MIHVLAPRQGIFAMGDFVRNDHPALAEFVALESYEDMFRRGSVPLGAYIFTALDQLTETETELVCRLHQSLEGAAPALPRLNHPARWKGRLALLDAAFDAGINPFRATRLGSARPRRFPVFLRSESQHSGSLSPLLHDAAALRRAVLAAMLRGSRYGDLLVMEYCHTADGDGVFRKYSAMIVGNAIVPRSLTASRDWITKVDGRFTDRTAAAADRQYVLENPHEAWLRSVATLAGVEYGRADYAMLDGRPVLWEVNTNPTIGGNVAFPNPSPWPPELRGQAGNLLAYEKIHDALAVIDLASRAAAPPGAEMSFPVSGAERRRLERERARRDRYLGGRTALALVALPLRRLRRAMRSSSGR